MTGQKLYRKTHESVYQEEAMFIRAPQGHSGNNLDFSTCSLIKIERGYATFRYHIGVSRNEDSIKIRRTCTVCFSLVSPLDQNPDPKYKPCLHLKNHHHLLFVLILEAAQNPLDFFQQTANGSVLCYNTVLAEFLTKIINIKNGSERFVKA